MVGYPESFTDPSYFGQILILTFPLIGNYGIPPFNRKNYLDDNYESDRIQISGLVVSDYSENYSHWNSKESLSEWLKRENIPAITGIDTRELTKKLREHGTMLGKIIIDNNNIDFYDPNELNLASVISSKTIKNYGKGKENILLMDCGCKKSIVKNLVKRDMNIKMVPWDYDLSNEEFDGLVVSSGPGDPKKCRQSIFQIRNTIRRKKPILGICLGHQLLALAGGGNTYKLKYGHRSQNQPVIESKTNKCFVTSQNHGFAVETGTLPKDWNDWFVNLNDNTNEGIIHKSGLYMSVQFHPEASPGPTDAEYIFDNFVNVVKYGKKNK